LTDDQDRPYSQFIYDKILLQETRSVLEDHSRSIQNTVIPERDVFELTKQYYERIKAKKNLGESLTRKFARWEEIPNVHELLRGKKGVQHSFVVIEIDPGLEQELIEVSTIEDRWERKRALRSLSSRLASISVSVYVPPSFVPERYSNLDATGNFWLLKAGFYDSQRGIDLDPGDSSEEVEANWGMLL
jgi:CRISPR-associated endonuclease/helicase Cas3